jgi:LEA14-like dessication related protein
MRKLAVVTALAAALAGAGCASLGRQVFEEPVVTFKGVQINGLGVSGGALDVILSVYNPNGFDLNATRLTYRLLVDSAEVGTGAIDQRFTVQDNDSTVVRLPINFQYAGLGAAGRQLLSSGTVNYRVLGDVTVSTPLGNFTRPYDRTGRYTALRGSSSNSP